MQFDKGRARHGVPLQQPGPYLYIRLGAMRIGEPGNEITVFDKSTFEGVTRITDGVMTLHPEFTADGAFVSVSDWQGGVVRAYDSETLGPVTTIEGIENPTGIFNTSRKLETPGH